MLVRLGPEALVLVQLININRCVVGLSIIIPVSKDDLEWKKLYAELSFLDIPYECIFVSPLNNDIKSIHSSWIISDVEQRAYQMNLGASVAQYDFLWFLHSDSKIIEILPKLEQFLNTINKDSIYYFDLRFNDSKTVLTKLNELGVFIRCKLLDLPFGDQGLLMSKIIFKKLGNFDESKMVGEDFYFIKLAKNKKIKIISLNNIIYTSARKYNTNGWFKTTCSHLKFTFTEIMK